MMCSNSFLNWFLHYTWFHNKSNRTSRSNSSLKEISRPLYSNMILAIPTLSLRVSKSDRTASNWQGFDVARFGSQTDWAYHWRRLIELLTLNLCTYPTKIWWIRPTKSGGIGTSSDSSGGRISKIKTLVWIIFTRSKQLWNHLFQVWEGRIEFGLGGVESFVKLSWVELASDIRN